MPEIGRISAVLELDGRKFKGELRQSVVQVDKFGKKVDATGKRVKSSFGSMTGSVKGLSTGIKILAGGAVLGLAIRQLGRLGKSAIDVSRTFGAQERSVNAVSGSLKAGGENMAFVRKESERLGVSTDAVVASLKGLTIAMRGTINEGANTREIVSNFLSVNAILGGTEDEAKRVGRALAQMGTLGKISAEELNQLADAGIPAFRALKDLVEGTGNNFQKLQQTGKLLTTDLLLPLSREIAKSFGVETTKRVVNFNAELGRTANAFRVTLGTIGDFVTNSPAIQKGLQSLQDGFHFIRETVLTNKSEIEAWVESTVTGATRMVQALAGVESAYKQLGVTSKVLVELAKGAGRLLNFAFGPALLGVQNTSAPVVQAIAEQRKKVSEALDKARLDLQRAQENKPSIKDVVLTALGLGELTGSNKSQKTIIQELKTQIPQLEKELARLNRVFRDEATRTIARQTTFGVSQGSVQGPNLPPPARAPIQPIKLNFSDTGAKIKTVEEIVKDLNLELSKLNRHEATVASLGRTVAEGLGLQTSFTDERIQLLNQTLSEIDPKAKGAKTEIKKLEEQLRSLFSKRTAEQGAEQINQRLEDLVASTQTPLERLQAQSQQLRGLLGRGEDARVHTRLRQLREEYVKTIPAMRLFKQVSDTVFDGIATALDGVIRGTQSLEEAFKNLAQTITAQLANQALRKILELAGNAIVGGISSGIGGGAAPQSSGSVTAGPTPFSSAALNSVPSGPSFGSAGFARQETPTINVIMVPDENAADRQQRELEAIGQIVDRRFMSNVNNGPLGSTYLRALSANRGRA